MGSNDSSESEANRRNFLSAVGVAGITGLLAGCQRIVSQVETSDTDREAGGSDDFDNDVSNGWLTFGGADEWGMRYNQSTDEFEIVHGPFEEESRKNIRIEADNHSGEGDKGDIYIDDSLIVQNEVEASDGSVSDPSYNFFDQNDTGLWRDGGGIIGVATAGTTTAKFDNGSLEVAGDIRTTDESGPTVWDGESRHAPTLPASTAITSGDGSTTTFSLPHSLDGSPSVVTVTPTSADAAGEFWVSDKSAGAVEITYSSPPTDGVENLTYDIIVSM